MSESMCRSGRVPQGWSDWCWSSSRMTNAYLTSLEAHELIDTLLNNVQPTKPTRESSVAEKRESKPSTSCPPRMRVTITCSLRSKSLSLRRPMPRRV